jgi:outer membrane lipoprotein-sorting protein
LKDLASSEFFIRNITVKKVLIFLGMIIVVVFVGINNTYAEPRPKDILQRADEARGNLEGVQWRVHVQSIERGLENERLLDVKARGYDFLGIVLAPPKAKRQKVLMVNHNMWFAKPGLRKPVPLSSRQKLIGSAAYGDIAATNYSDDYRHKILGTEAVTGEMCYVFDLKAATKKATYDRIKYWVSQRRTVGVKAEYYTVSGKIFKWATFEYKNQIRLKNKPHPFISKITFYDALVTGDITIMRFSRGKIVKVPPSTLDVNLLMIR